MGIVNVFSTAKIQELLASLSSTYATKDELAAVGGAFVVDDTPAAPAEGTSATYFVTSAVSWPAGLVWSTDPDGGAAPTIAGTALVSLFTVGGTTRAIMGATFPAAPTTTTTTTAAGTTTTTTTAAGTTTTTTTTAGEAPTILSTATAIYDARDLSGLGVGGSVSTWTPRVGSVDLTAVGTGATYNTDSTRNYVRTGANTYLTAPIAFSQPDTVVIVWKPTDFPSVGVPIVGSGTLIHALFTSNVSHNGGINAGVSLGNGPKNDTPGHACMFAGRFDGASSSMWAHGTSYPGNAGTNARTTLQVAANTAATTLADIEVSWLGVWPAKLTDQDLADIQAWLTSEGVIPV